MPPAPTVLAFRDVPFSDGDLEVLDPQGQVVARVENDKTFRNFTARTPDGATLCTGSPRRLKRTYLVLGADEKLLLTFRNPALSMTRTEIRLADGPVLTLKSKRKCTVSDRSGRAILSIEWTRKPKPGDDMVVQVLDPECELRFVVAVVAGWLGNRARSTVWDLVSDPQHT